MAAAPRPEACAVPTAKLLHRFTQTCQHMYACLPSPIAHPTLTNLYVRSPVTLICPFFVNECIARGNGGETCSARGGRKIRGGWNGGGRNGSHTCSCPKQEPRRGDHLG